MSEQGATATDALDLTPRPVGATPRRRRWPWVLVVAAIVVALGFVLSRAVTDAAMFFYNADEAVAKQAELGDTRFRLQGSVVGGTTNRTADGVSFAVRYNGATVAVHHVGDPPDLFSDGIPVVLEGRWESTQPGAVFASDRMLVKHDATYDAQNPDRVKQATSGGTQPVAPVGGQ